MAHRGAKKQTKRAYKRPRPSYVSHIITPGNTENQYERLTRRELKTIFKSRGLKRPSNTCRNTYIRLLTNADQSYSFRFFDLPPEVRNNIYRLVILEHGSSVQRHHIGYRQFFVPGYMVSAFGKKAYCKIGHALCYASRQLRNETLAMYFSRHTVSFKIATSYPMMRGNSSTHTESRSISIETQDLLARLTDEHVGAMSELKIWIPERRYHMDYNQEIKLILEKHSVSDPHIKPRITAFKTSVILWGGYITDVMGERSEHLSCFLNRKLTAIFNRVKHSNDPTLKKSDLNDILGVFSELSPEEKEDKVWALWTDFWDRVDEIEKEIEKEEEAWAHWTAFWDNVNKDKSF